MTSDFISKYSFKNTGLLAQEKCVSQLCELDEKTQDFFVKGSARVWPTQSFKTWRSLQGPKQIFCSLHDAKTTTKSENHC